MSVWADAVKGETWHLAQSCGGTAAKRSIRASWELSAVSNLILQMTQNISVTILLLRSLSCYMGLLNVSRPCNSQPHPGSPNLLVLKREWASGSLYRSPYRPHIYLDVGREWNGDYYKASDVGGVASKNPHVTPAPPALGSPLINPT